MSANTHIEAFYYAEFKQYGKKGSGIQL